LKSYKDEIKGINPDPRQVYALKNSPTLLQFLSNDQTGNIRLDSAEASVYHFLRDLEHVKIKVLEVKYPELTARKIFPVDNTTPEGAEKTGYEIVDYIGGAKIQANNTNDIRRVDIKSDWIDVKVKQVENFYDYSFRDIRAAQFSGRPLQQTKAKASQRDIEEQINTIAWAGDSAFKINGVLSDGNGIIETALSATMANMTPEELNDAITAKAAEMHSASRGVFSPDTLVLPPAQYDRLFDARFLQSTDLSPGQWILKNNRHVKRILPAPELMADSGVNRFKVPVGVLFEYNRDYIALEVPMAPTMRAPHPTLTGFQVLNEARVAGAFVKQPLSARIITGI